VLFFLWLPSAEMAIARVESRVKQGGHNVPSTDIRRRYAAGLKNFFDTYRQIPDEWRLYDASDLPPKLIAVHQHGKLMVKQKKVYQRIERQAEKTDAREP
jgi:predicted ABC-type ATPase